MRIVIALCCVLSLTFAQKLTFFLLATGNENRDQNLLKNIEEKLANKIKETLPKVQNFELTCEVQELKEQEVYYLKTLITETRQTYPVKCNLETGAQADRVLLENYFKIENKNVNSWELSELKLTHESKPEESSLCPRQIACIVVGISVVLCLLALLCWCRKSPKHSEEFDQHELELSRSIQPMGISCRQLKSVLMRASTCVDERTIDETLEYLKLGEPFTDEDIKCVMNHMCIDMSKFSRAFQRDLQRIQQNTETDSTEIKFMSPEMLEFHLENLEHAEIRDGLTLEKLKNLLEEFKCDGDLVEIVVRELKLTSPYSLQQVREIFSCIQSKETKPKEISSLNTAVLDEALEEFNFEYFNPEDLVNEMSVKFAELMEEGSSSVSKEGKIKIVTDA